MVTKTWIAEETIVTYGFVALLRNVFWYFGGFDSYNRQVKLLEELFNINLFSDE